MTWLLISYQCRPEQLDDLKDLLENFGAVSISYSGLSTEPVFDDESNHRQYWDINQVSALFSMDIDVDILTACVRNRLGPENVSGCKIESLPDRDWTQESQSAFQAMSFGQKLCVCPSWQQKPDDVPYIIELDPGLAFGTGSHATTALCLEWLVNNDINGVRLIDYGCGSGILAIAAAKLGAKEIVAIDNDQQAINATIANAEKNKVYSLIKCGLPGEFEISRADILLANILLKPLQDLSSSFSTMLNPGGRIVLSGILVSQLAELMENYRSWVDFEAPAFRDEWVMISGRNRSSAG